MKQPVVRELIWIVCIGIVAVVITFLLGGFSGSTSIDVQLHDTYFVLYGTHVVLSLFFIIAFVTYLVRLVSQRLGNVIANWIMFVVTAGLTFMIVQFYRLITMSTDLT